jgi:hypothetical protein
MKNTIVKYGLISGGISGVLLLVTTLIFKYVGYDKIGFENSSYVGYTFIAASMSVIYFGIKAFRDLQNGGVITFLKALLVGLGIMLISCIIYSLAWLVIYYFFIPTFMDDYGNFCIQKVKNTGGSQVDLANKIKEISQMKEWYKNPFSIFALTLIEPTPVGFLVSIVSALVLKKK